MKKLILVCMTLFLVGSFTMSATTPMLDTKEKSVVLKTQDVEAVVLNVVSSDLVISYDAIIIASNDFNVGKVNNFMPCFVSWNESFIAYKSKHKHIAYTEKLHSNYNYNRKQLFHSLGLDFARSNC